MRPSQIRGALRRLLGTPVPEDARHRDALEARLLGDATPARAGAPGWGRWALATAGSAALLIGACRYPVEYDVPLGARVGILVDAERRDDLDIQAIVAHVEETHDLDELEVQVRMEKHVRDGESVGTVRVQLDMLGGDVNADEVWEELIDAFPTLEGSRMEEQLLEAHVHGTLGGKLSHAWLDVVIDRHGVEEARERVFEELEARGFEGKADVEISDEGGRRAVKIKLREKVEAPTH